MLRSKLNWILLGSFLIITSCVELKDVRVCAVAGRVSAGGFCSHSNSGDIEELSFAELMDLLEGKSVIIPIDDFNEMKTELEDACRELGSSCTIQTKQSIRAFTRQLNKVKNKQE